LQKHQNLKIKILLPLLLIFSRTVVAQVSINEVCTKSYHTIPDDFGQYSDWIELYNNGTSDVNLNGYHLSDDPASLLKWTFGNIIIKAKDYLLVFASDTNINTLPVLPDTVGNITPYTITYADSQATPIAGLSHVDTLDYHTILGVEGGKNVISAKMYFENNTGFGKLGYSFAFVYMFLVDWSATAVDRSMYNRVMVKGYIEKGRKITVRFVQKDLAEFWLGYGYVLEGNGINNYVYEVPIVGDVGPLNTKLLTAIIFEAMPPYGTTEIRIKDCKFYNAKKYVHSNFKLSAGGETVILSNAAGTIIQQIDVPALHQDNSYGLQPDGSTNKLVFNAPTPGKTNNLAVAFSGYCDANLVFSIDAGFYSTPQSISISGSPDIRYTIDGTDPKAVSPLYVSPINLIKTTVIKAACFNGKLPGKIYTNTYFINDKSTLPVFSISTDPANFFDDTIGIYVLGPHADSVNGPNFGANFWEDWERPVYIEFFNKSGTQCFEQGGATKIYGNYSRANPMKSLLLKCKKEYGADRFNYKFFNDKNIFSFDEIVLRNSGNDFNYTHIWDATNHEAVKNIDIDRMAYQPAVVFINGQYWGVHHIREKISEEYIFNNHGVYPKKVDLSDAWGQAIAGKNNLPELVNVALTKDMSVDANYHLLADSFDIHSMIDYFAANIYISNWDWPQNNLKFWRPKEGNRQFRYLMFDTDVSLGMYDIFTLQTSAFNQMGRLLDTSRIDPHSRIFRALAKNKTFRDYFINRSADLMNTIYTPQNFKNVAYSLRDTIAPEMPKHFARWGPSDWANNIAKLTSFMDARPPFARAQIQSEFKLKKQVNVTLNVSPAEAGFIKISTIYPPSYPWTGVYYDGVPVEIVAYPNPGYTFSYWKSDHIIATSNTSKNVILNIDTNDTFTAYFSGSKAALELTISEINYNSPITADAGDWLELHNYGTAAIDISGWVLKDEIDYNMYSFPANTILEANGYLVIYNDSVKFSNIHPFVNNKTGPFSFNLSNGGGQIRLYDLKGNNYLSMTYNDSVPWPMQADGNGYTLELLDPKKDMSSAGNWVAGCLKGSPGKAYDKNCTSEIAEDLMISEIQCYPNPNEGIFNLVYQSENTEDLNIRIINLQGQMIYEQSIQSPVNGGVYTIDISGSPAGIYSVILSSSSQVHVKKVIVL
jgi:hypothetical protein